MTRKATTLLLFLILFLPLYSAGLVSENEAEEDFGWASKASEKWHSSTPLTIQETKLKPVNYLIPSPYGEFDPLVTPSPVPKLNLDDSQKLALIQLESNYGDLIFELSDEFGFSILDRISTNVWMVKILQNNEINNLGDNLEVRWFTYLPLGWKLHPILNSIEAIESITVLAVLSPELGIKQIENLERELMNSGIDVVSCGITDCVINLVNSQNNQLERLLVDDRIVWVEPSISYVLTNAQAGEQSGVQAVLSNWNSGLNGSGETVSIVDTGLDMDHSDYNSQLIAVQNGFGLDNNPADSISGHGTHVTGTLLGDGSGESEAMGIAPAATLHMYQLENNQQGVIARIGSIYDLMQDAYDNGARFQSTSWVSENAGGQYNGDSQSVDKFLWNNRDFIAIYSAGNNGSGGVNTVAAPSTAKNVISVGASTDAIQASVASFSGQGPTFDGRIKPDLVAPGENICSSRAQEATSSQGTDCTDAFHSDGTTPLHTSLSGASQATPVVSGAAVLTRQYLREELGISSPGSDLVRAILVHGAEDLGSKDVPNSLEGWGRLDLENSLYPVHSNTQLDTWYDQSQTLDPGRMFIYAYELDSSKGLEVTLAWNDEDVSSSSLQTSPKLLNDLDLVVIAPDGTTYLGNDFANGVSTIGGLADDLNNLERIRINPTVSSSTGVWQIQVHHRGGTSQEFSIVTTGYGQEESSSDLSSIDDSLWISESTPMVNTGVLIRASWVNQANLITGTYQVSVTDLTTGELIMSETRSPLEGGGIDSIQKTHTFSVTGNHDLQLIIDVGDNVNELNEGNNIFNISFIVAAEGVRLEMLNSEGIIDNLREYSLDPFNETDIDLNFRLEHQGTETENVQFSVLSIRAVDEANPLYTLQTKDTWTSSINLTDSIISMNPDGAEGSIVDFTLNLDNIDADLESSPKYYASAETIIVEVVSSYVNNPLVTDSLKFTIVIEPIADLEVIIAGTGTEVASPGEWAKFSQGIRNTGNSPTTFQLSCITQSNWEVKVGRNSMSNVYELERMDQGVELSTEILVRVPTVVEGLPSLGQTEEVYCTVTDIAETINGFETTLIITVGEQATFETTMFDSDGVNIEPALYEPSLAVKPSEMVNLRLNVENTGNVILDLDLNLERSETDWNYNVYLSNTENPLDGTSFSVAIDSSIDVIIEILVPSNAIMGSFNNLEIKVELTPFIYSLNTTKLILEEMPELSIIEYNDPCIAVAGKYTECSILLQNTGNVDLPMSWPESSDVENTGIIVPQGWYAFLSNTPGVIGASEQKTIKLHVKTDSSVPVSTSELLEIRSTSQLPSGDVFFSSLELNVNVEVSTIISLSLVNQEGGELEESTFFDLEAGTEKEFMIEIFNFGNLEGDVEIAFNEDQDWQILCEDEIISVQAGSQKTISCKLLVSKNGAPLTELSFVGLVSNGIENSTAEVGELILRVSSPEIDSKGTTSFVSSFMPQLFVGSIVLLLLLFVGFRLRNVSNLEGDGSIQTLEPMLDPMERLDLLMNKGNDDEDDAISGGVDKSEIDAALNQSKLSLPTLPGMPSNSNLQTPNLLPKMPSLPTPPSAKVFGPPPIPPEGIPPGWTMEQWIHYGHQWLKENRK